MISLKKLATEYEETKNETALKKITKILCNGMCETTAGFLCCCLGMCAKPFTEGVLSVASEPIEIMDPEVWIYVKTTLLDLANEILDSDVVRMIQTDTGQAILIFAPAAVICTIGTYFSQRGIRKLCCRKKEKPE